MLTCCVTHIMIEPLSAGPAYHSGYTRNKRLNNHAKLTWNPTTHKHVVSQSYLQELSKKLMVTQTTNCSQCVCRYPRNHWTGKYIPVIRSTDGLWARQRRFHASMLTTFSELGDWNRFCTSQCRPKALQKLLASLKQSWNTLQRSIEGISNVIESLFKGAQSLTNLMQRLSKSREPLYQLLTTLQR